MIKLHFVGDGPRDEATVPYLVENIQQSARRGEPVTPILTEIARLVDERRCVHRDETGFAYFAEDVRREAAHLADNP